MALLIGLTNLFSGCSLFPQKEEIVAPPLVKPKTPEYRLYAVKHKTIVNKIQVSGHLVPAIDYSLYFEKAGRLEGIMVKSGDRVTKWQVLARLNAEDLQNQVELAEIELRKAEIMLNQAKDALSAAKFSAGQDIRNAQYAVQRTQLDVDTMRLNLKILKGNMQSAALTSPIDGEVIFVDVNIKKGDSVEPYKTIVQVADINALHIMFDAKKLDDPGILKIGMNAELAFGTEKMTGRIVTCPYSMPLDVEEKNSDDVILEVEKMPEGIKMGDSIDISIILEKRDNVLTIPLEGLHSYMGRNYVYLLEDKSKREVNVEVGIKSSSEVEITSGLMEGKQVILR